MEVKKFNTLLRAWALVGLGSLNPDSPTFFETLTSSYTWSSYKIIAVDQIYIYIYISDDLYNPRGPMKVYINIWEVYVWYIFRSMFNLRGNISDFKFEPRYLEL